MEQEQALDWEISFGMMLRFALPTILSSIFMSIYTTVDGIFVSRLIDTDALSAVTVVMPIIMVTSAIGMMFGSGGNALIVRKIREGREEEAGQYIVYYLGGGILLSLVMVLYIYIKTNLGYHALQLRLKQIQKDMVQSQKNCGKLPENLRDTEPVLYRMADYMKKVGGFSAYSNTNVTYFPFGEVKFKEMLHQLAKAESFIFMEYFIVEEGYMWNSILEILKEKAAQGVEVRVMYDGTCAFSTLPYSYPEH